MEYGGGIRTLLKEEFIHYFKVFYILFHHYIFLADNGIHVP